VGASCGRARRLVTFIIPIEETWLVFEHHEKTRIWQLRKQSGENDNPSHDRATTVERWRELAKGRA